MGLHMVRGKALEVKAYTQGGSRVSFSHFFALIVISPSTGFVNCCPTDTSILFKPWYKEVKTQKDFVVPLHANSLSANIVLREVLSGVPTKLCPPPLTFIGIAGTAPLALRPNGSGVSGMLKRSG